MAKKRGGEERRRMKEEEATIDKNLPDPHVTCGKQCDNVLHMLALN
jgi:hypothetical protein